MKKRNKLSLYGSTRECLGGEVHHGLGIRDSCRENKTIRIRMIIQTTQNHLQRMMRETLQGVFNKP